MGDHWITTCHTLVTDLSPRSNTEVAPVNVILLISVDAMLQVKPMEEAEAPAEVKGEPAQTANITPSKPRQSGHAASKKQSKAVKQLRFEGHTGADLAAKPHLVLSKHVQVYAVDFSVAELEIVFVQCWRASF